MSVQVKKKFDELTTYLGRDTKGLAKAKELKDCVNILRTQKAAAEATAARDAALLDGAVAKAHAAETELVAARVEIQRLTQRVTNLARRIGELTAEPEPEEDDDDVKAGHSDIKTVVKKLRKYQRFCPSPAAVTRSIVKVGIYAYDRNSIAQGWSHQSLWSLGATVALIAAIHGSVTVQTDETIQGIDGGQESDYLDDTKKHLVQWYSENNVNFD